MKKSSSLVLSILFFLAVSPLQTSAANDKLNNTKTTETIPESARARNY
jgi:hypothetical protein